MQDKNKIIIITGPTASGKSDIAIELSKIKNGEIVCCDSMQIYKEMNIGTAKTLPCAQQNIFHHMQDIISPNENYSVALYKNEASKIIRQISDYGKLPIICGGTGQYISSILEGTQYTEIKTDLKLRADLESEYDKKGKEYFYNYLHDIDPLSADKLHINDKKRVLRAIEIYLSTGFTKSYLDVKSKEKGPEFNCRVFCIYHERDILYERINQRVDIMIEKGLLSEVENIFAKYPDISKTASQAIGYKELKEYSDGLTDFETAVANIKQASRNYAKRQLTWFRKIDKMVWVKNEGIKNTLEIILKEIQQ